MSKYVLLKSKEDILLLKMPEKFSTTYEILRIEDEITLNKLIHQKQKLNPNVNLLILQSDTEKENLETSRKNKVLSLKQGDYYNVYKQEEVLYIRASGSYSNINLLNHRELTVAFSLADIESKLSEEYFIRIHRSAIVNINYVTKFIGNTLFIGETTFSIGRKFKKALISRLNLVSNSKKLISEDFSDD